MAYKEVLRVEISEVIRRWQAGNSRRHIALGTGLSKDTVGKYIVAAEALGIARYGSGPDEEQLSRLAGVSRSGPRQAGAPTEEKLAPWADQIYQWLTVDRLQVTRIQELLAERDCRVPYTSLHRFVARRHWQRRRANTVRMEQSGPGEVAEVDFGRLGYIQDQEAGRRCTVWALLVVLTYSRHSFLWPVYSQKLEEVIAGLEAAWAFFGGNPKYLVVDNFPAAVASADALHPVFTRGFLEYSQHRGFIVDPARVRHPKDKPRVERGIQYVRERFFKGGEFRDLAHLRSEAVRWCRDVAGLRIHGTTRRQPLQVFLEEEGSDPGSLERRALRGHPLAHRQGSPRSPRSLPVRPLLGSLHPVPARAAGGGRPGRESGAHLPPGQTGEGPPPPAPGRPLHRHCRLPCRVERLHPQGSRRHQAQRRRAGSRSGRIRRAPPGRPPALVQNPAGPQAPAVGPALHPRTPGRRLPEGPGGGPD